MSILIFYLFAGLMALSALMVISLRNPVHSVLFLIFAFFNAAGLFILLGAEYIAMTLVIVYVGAVAVLFLFVVMMLNVNVSQLRQGFLKSLPLGIFLGVLTFIQISIALLSSRDSFAPAMQESSNVENTVAIGRILYTEYLFVFQGCGVILLVAMVGAILLTLSHGAGVRRQNIAQQIKRTKEQSVKLVKVKTGQGVKV